MIDFVKGFKQGYRNPSPAAVAGGRVIVYLMIGILIGAGMRIGWELLG